MLQPAGPVASDPRRRDQPVEAYNDDFRRNRRAYVERHGPTGLEPREHVVRRFDAGVREQAEAGGPLVLATHGMAMTPATATIGLDDPAGSG